MNRIELLEKIHARIPKNSSKKERSRLEKELFEEKSGEIYDNWNNTSNKLDGEQWKQFVRLALDYENIMKMYSRISQLVSKYGSYGNYFKANFQNIQCRLPDRRSQFEFFMGILKDYFEIFQQITNQINFDLETQVFTDRAIRGRINWDLTLKKSFTPFPLQFETIQNQKNFVTPENILLVLCVVWINKRSLELQKTEFSDPLSINEIQLLANISKKTKEILMNFPFAEITNEALARSSSNELEPFVDNLTNSVIRRINEGKIQNPWYRKLIEWLSKFRRFGFAKLKQDNLNNNFIVEATKNLDALYEIWIFFEMMYRFDKHVNITLHLDSSPQFFEFDLNNHVIRIVYEKEFNVEEQTALVLKHTPDFSVMNGDEMIAVFDAKNWKHSSDEHPMNKILAYMANLDCGLGAVFWPKESTPVRSSENMSTPPKFHHHLQIFTMSLNPYDEKYFDDYTTAFNDLYFKICSQLEIS